MIQLLPIALLFYFLGVVAALVNLVARRPAWARLTPVLVLVTLSFLCWTAILVYLLSYYRYRMESLNLIIPFLVLVLMLITALLPAGTLRVEEGRSPLDKFHVVVAILGVSMLFVTFAASLIYLVLDLGLKKKRPLLSVLQLPPLEMCDRVGFHSLIACFTLLTLGVITGAIASAGGTDASFPWRREGASILAWVILAVILIARLTRGWRGRRAAILTIIAFAGILIRMLVRF
jgi:ABC-type uncharacterized transport system permease subunit